MAHERAVLGPASASRFRRMRTLKVNPLSSTHSLGEIITAESFYSTHRRKKKGLLTEPLPLTLRLNAPRPLACPPAALSREDSKRRTRILTEEHNDACECVEMGLPPPEHPNFTEHSPFCQVHVCYAREVGCCDPDFKRQNSGLELAENLPCTCLEGAFEFGWRWGLVPGFEAVGKRELT